MITGNLKTTIAVGVILTVVIYLVLQVAAPSEPSISTPVETSKPSSTTGYKAGQHAQQTDKGTDKSEKDKEKEKDKGKDKDKGYIQQGYTSQQNQQIQIPSGKSNPMHFSFTKKEDGDSLKVSSKVVSPTSATADYTFTISPKSKLSGLQIGIPLAMQDLYLHDMDATSQNNIDSLKVFTSPTFLHDKTVFDIDSNGHVDLAMLFGGFPKKYTFISTSSTEDKQMSLATTVREFFKVRQPVIDLETKKFSDFKDCSHKADIVIVNDFSYFESSFSSLEDSVDALHCITGQVLLVGVPSKQFDPKYKAEIAAQFEDLEVLASKGQHMWFAAYTQVSARPVNARGVVDAPTYLKRISSILDLPFADINPSLYPAACAEIDNPLAEVVSEKIDKDTLLHNYIATCVLKYDDKNVIKIASSDLGAKEEYILTKLHEASPSTAAHFQKPQSSHYDDLVGLSSTVLTPMEGEVVSEVKPDMYGEFQPLEVLKMAQDAVTILEALQKANIIHRDITGDNLVIQKDKSLGLTNFIYAVTDGMPFSGYTPSELNRASYEDGYDGQCDLAGMATAINTYLAPLYPFLSIISDTLKEQMKQNCKLDAPALQKTIDTLVEREQLCNSPNKFAGRPSIKKSQLGKDKTQIKMEGYQGWQLEYAVVDEENELHPSQNLMPACRMSNLEPTPNVEEKDRVLFTIDGTAGDTKKKMEILDGFLNDLTCEHAMTALDIGTNTGFVCLRSLQKDVAQCTGIDIDPEVLDAGRQVRDMLKFDTVWRIHNMRLSELQAKNATFNIVYGFAVVHWLFSCTEMAFSLDVVVGNLRAMTLDVLLIEWVMETDDLVKGFHHTVCPKGYNCEYTTVEFEKALNKHFSVVKKLDKTRGSREVYAAFVDPIRCTADYKD